MKYALCWAAVLTLIASPALANYPCYSSRCYVPAVRTKVIYRDRVKVLQVPFVVVPTYSATFLPPPPVVVQQGSTAVVPQSVNYTSQQSAYGFAAGAAVATQAVGVQAQQVQQVQQTQGTAVTADALAVALERINQRLCALEGTNGNGHNGNGTPPPNGNLPGQPLSKLKPGEYPKNWNRCAVCHTAGKMKGEGNTFAMFDGPGKLAKLSDRQTKNILLKVGIGAMPPKDNKEGVPANTQQDVDETFDYINSLK